MFFSGFRLNPLSLKSKILLYIIRFLYSIVDIFLGKKWEYPINNFEEDPKTMGLFGVIYLGYKYLFKPHNKSTKYAGLEQYFKNQIFSFSKSIGNTYSSFVTMHIGGDLIPYFLFNKQSCKYLWDYVGDYFFDADVTIANLECAIDKYKQKHFSPEIMLGNVYFNATKEIFDIFCKYGKARYDVLLTANNHSLDAGETGHYHTLAFLRQRNINYIGSRIHKHETGYVIMKKNGIKIGMVNYTFSLNKNVLQSGNERKINVLRLNKPTSDISQLKRDIFEVRKRSDFVMAFLHMGNSYQAYPSQHIVDMFHRIFQETGVDVIVGGHPHEPQQMEMYNFIDPLTRKQKSGFAIYSLGDFISYDVLSWCHLSLILELVITKTHQKTFLTDVKVLPLYDSLSFGNDNTYYFRLLPLLSTIRLIKSGKKFDFLQQDHIEEMYELEKFLYTYILPKYSKNLIKNI